MRHLMLTLFLAVGAAGSPGSPALPAGDCLALGTCCCTLRDGTQCCGSAGNCASGIVPGCNCNRRG